MDAIMAGVIGSLMRMGARAVLQQNPKADSTGFTFFSYFDLLFFKLMEQRITSPWTTARIIETIQTARISRVRELLQQPELDAHLELAYETFGLSVVKMEFLKRDLHHLADTQLDLVHYSAFIRTTKESDRAPDPQTLLEFIHAEVRPIFVKYITVNR